MQNIVKQTAKTGKQAAVATAQKIAQENLEFLKSARSQVLATPEITPSQNQTPQAPSPDIQADTQLKAKIDADSKRQLDKLEAELKQIRTQREQKIVESRQELQPQVQQQKAVEVTNPPGKLKKAVGGMIKRLTGKREMQKNVGG